MGGFEGRPSIHGLDRLLETGCGQSQQTASATANREGAVVTVPACLPTADGPVDCIPPSRHAAQAHYDSRRVQSGRTSVLNQLPRRVTIAR